jgi:hypothetical protein
MTPVLDENGEQVFVDDVPAWIDVDGNGYVGYLCPVQPEPEPAYVPPVSLPNTGDGSTYVPVQIP